VRAGCPACVRCRPGPAARSATACLRPTSAGEGRGVGRRAREPAAGRAAPPPFAPANTAVCQAFARRRRHCEVVYTPVCQPLTPRHHGQKPLTPCIPSVYLGLLPPRRGVNTCVPGVCTVPTGVEGACTPCVPGVCATSPRREVVYTPVCQGFCRTNVSLRWCKRLCAKRLRGAAAAVDLL
jgi:hypothetical protein